MTKNYGLKIWTVLKAMLGLKMENTDGNIIKELLQD